jgi:hypothetical protein
MNRKIVGLVFAAAASAWAQPGCIVNGVDLGCTPYTGGSNGTVVYSTFASPIGTAYQLTIPDVGNDEAIIYNHPDQENLGNVNGTFNAYVPGAAVNGGFDSLAPYMYFEVGLPSDPTTTYALVIVAASGYTMTNDAWYTDGANANSTVHIVIFGDPSVDGITNPDWTTCCSDLPTLSQLDSVALTGAQAGVTWGDLPIHGVLVGIGTYGGNGGPFTAYVDGFDVTTPEPGTAMMLLLGFPVLLVGRRYMRKTF